MEIGITGGGKPQCPLTHPDLLKLAAKQEQRWCFDVISVKLKERPRLWARCCKTSPSEMFGSTHFQSRLLIRAHLAGERMMNTNESDVGAAEGPPR